MKRSLAFLPILITLLSPIACGKLNPTAPAVVSGPAAVHTHSFAFAFRVPKVGGGNAVNSGVAAAANGTIYVSDTSDHAVEAFNSNGVAQTIFGASSLSGPGGLAYDDASGTLFVTDSVKGVVEFDQNASAVVTIAGGSVPAPFNIALSQNGLFYVAQNGVTVQQCSNTAGCTGVTINLTPADALDSPFGVSLDGSGNLWIGDGHNNQVQEFNATTGAFDNFVFGGPVTGSGPSTLTTAQFATLGDTKVAPNGNIVVLDSSMKVLKEFSPTGTYLGNFTNSDSVSGIKVPNFLYVDSNNIVYLTDSLTSYVSVFKPN